MKRPGGKGATPLQRRELAAWHDAGAVCAVVRSVDDVKHILGPIIDCPEGRDGVRPVVATDSFELTKT